MLYFPSFVPIISLDEILVFLPAAELSAEDELSLKIYKSLFIFLPTKPDAVVVLAPVLIFLISILLIGFLMDCK